MCNESKAHLIQNIKFETKRLYFLQKDLISKEIEMIDQKYTTTVCGSFRRGADSSGDIDILVTHPRFNDSC